ncbi:MAG: hemerythrin domain-containing protein [Deltaproteobacteria bacterium]|nr:hemerythrin domain-containing protein [Deltaproteobacteria bacterium]
MKPIGPLMWEHRLIESMVSLVRKEIVKINEESEVRTTFIDVIVDFFRIYADRTHHGKEEDILFRELKKKKMDSQHETIMNELIEEHTYGRKTVGRLIDAKEYYERGDSSALGEIVERLKELSEFYPRHIEKEDKRFFYPCLEYFSQNEQDEMLKEFWTFDRNMIHEKYRKVVEEYGGKVLKP